MANSPLPGVVATSDDNMPHDDAATTGTNINDTLLDVVQFDSVATEAANLSTDSSPLLNVIAVDNPSTKRLQPSPPATVSTTSRGIDKHPALNNTTTEIFESFFGNKEATQKILLNTASGHLKCIIDSQRRGLDMALLDFFSDYLIADPELL